MTTFLKLLKLLFSHGQQIQCKYNIFKYVFEMAACLLLMKFDIQTNAGFKINMDLFGWIPTEHFLSVCLYLSN